MSHPHVLIEVDGAYNFRDVGGGLTVDGQRLATGSIYRSAALDTVTEAGLATLDRLGIRTVIDLRSRAELEHHGRFPYERLAVSWHHFPSPLGPPATADDPRMQRFRSHPDPMSVMFELMVTEGRSLFGDALVAIAEAGPGAVVFHCTSGKDRTGLLSVLIQVIAGMDLQDTLGGFEFSAEAAKLEGHDMLRRFPQASSLTDDQIARLQSADPAWVLRAIDTIGGVGALPAWLDDMGVTTDRRAAISGRLGID